VSNPEVWPLHITWTEFDFARDVGDGSAGLIFEKQKQRKGPPCAIEAGAPDERGNRRRLLWLLAGPMKRKRPKEAGVNLFLVHQAPKAGSRIQAVSPGVWALPRVDFLEELRTNG